MSTSMLQTSASTMGEPPIKMRKLETEAGRIEYLVWPPGGRPPIKLNSLQKVHQFLEKEKLLGKVSLDSFDFKKPVCARRGAQSLGSTAKVKKVPQPPARSDVFAESDDEQDVDEQQTAGKFNLQNMLKSRCTKADHEKALKETGALLESLRFETAAPELEPSQFESLQNDLRKATSVKALVETLGTCDMAVQELAKLTERKCLEELLTLSSVEGPLPLSEWPVNLSTNWYAEVVKFAASHSPVTLSLLLKLVITDPAHGVSPENIFTLASIYAQLAKEVDKKNNALCMIQALSLKMDGLSDKGINSQAKLSLSADARTLRYKRDELAEVQTSLITEECKSFPYQVTLDNCNTQKTDCIVAYSQSETVDTSHLDSEGLNMEDTLRLFQPSIFMLNTSEHRQEFNHLQYVLMLALGRELATLLPDQVGHWQQVLPEHHDHPQSNLPPLKAQITILPPMHYRETEHKDMIAMAMELQMERLRLLLQIYPDNVQLSEDFDRIQLEITGEEAPDEKVEREAAEQRVKHVLLQHGELISHGDLLTFQRVRQAIMMQADEVRALDRLDFIGLFRLQIFHLTMSKVCTDIISAMPNVNKVEEKGSLANVAALLGDLGWFCNKKKQIVRGDNFERHAQTLKAYQLALLQNMFENHIKNAGVDLSAIKTEKQVLETLANMMESFGAYWYWDVDAEDPLADRDCGLFKASRDQVVRLALGLAFRQAQHENDALALRALRRVMIVYFAASTSKSKYALYTLHDMVGFCEESWFHVNKLTLFR